MAELVNLGKNCSLTDCNDLDFLPFQCDYCSQTFCLKHRLAESHNCEIWKQSQRNGENKSVTKKSDYEKYVCSLDGCEKVDLLPVLCRLCQKHFCLEHRLEFDHNCSHAIKSEQKQFKAAEFIKSLKKNDDKKPSQIHPSDKKDGLAAKVAYMKLKQIAVGDVQKLPPEERVYFYVELPENYFYKTSPFLPIGFSKVWTIGKCIDLIASLGNVPNKNNVAGAKKLRLFAVKDSDNRDDVELSVDEALSKLIENKIITDAGTLKLVYV